MFCRKHESSRMYIGTSKAELCGHETDWKYQKFCKTCSHEQKCCQECGEAIFKTEPLSFTDRGENKS